MTPPATILVPESSDSELVKWAPAFVVWPEGGQGDNPPWPKRGSDYHPRDISSFLDQGKLRRPTRIPMPLLLGAWFIWGLQALVVRVLPAIGVHLDLASLLFWSMNLGVAMTMSLALAGGGSALSDGILVSLIQVVVLGGLVLPEWLRSSRRGQAAMRARLQKHFESGLSDEVLTVDGLASPQSCWRKYVATIAVEPDKYPRTVYVRPQPVDDAGILVVQYWLFFYYNHWRNIHESDWEVVTLKIDTRRDVLVEIGGSTHFGGARRSRPAWFRGHPVVWVAAGSHALYLEYAESGFDVPARITLNNPLLRFEGNVAVGSSRDWVLPLIQDDEEPIVWPYRMQVVPDRAAVNPSHPAWASWWWLRFDGLWGRVGSVPSPWRQGLKWDNPSAWLATLSDQSATPG